MPETLAEMALSSINICALYGIILEEKAEL